MNAGLPDGFIFENNFVELLFEVVLFLIVDDFIVNDDAAHLFHGHFFEFFMEEFEFDGFELILELGDFIFSGWFVGLKLRDEGDEFGFFFVEAFEFVLKVDFLVIGLIVAFFGVSHVVFGSGKLWIVWWLLGLSTELAEFLSGNELDAVIPKLKTEILDAFGDRVSGWHSGSEKGRLCLESTRVEFHGPVEFLEFERLRITWIIYSRSEHPKIWPDQ